jgi:hypothetical protein
MTQKRLIVAKFNEDVTWLRDVTCPYVVYDKSQDSIPGSISRPNIGREAETLLYYILTQYDNLPEVTLFVQGDPRVKPDVLDIKTCVEQINGCSNFSFGGFLTENSHTDISNTWIAKPAVLHKALFLNYTPIVKFALGAQYVLPRANILARPRELYAALHACVVKFGDRSLQWCDVNLDNGIDAWTMENTWYELFDLERQLRPDYTAHLPCCAV